jgi:hypothetical protein
MEASPGMDFPNNIKSLQMGVAIKVATRYQWLQVALPHLATAKRGLIMGRMIMVDARERAARALCRKAGNVEMARFEGKPPVDVLSR